MAKINSLSGKVCLVTGANAGIGLETARGLAHHGARVLMVCRDAAKGNAARQDIIQSTGNQNVELLLCDFSSQAQIRKLAEEIHSQTSVLHVLVNNAGCFYTEFRQSEDGIEMQWAVNHLGYFLLTHLLMDLLQTGAPSRVINVSSRGHYRGKINFENIHHAPPAAYDGLVAYAQSKLGNVLFTYELARRLRGSGITVNCLHPGVVKTDIALKNARGKYYWVWALLKPFMITLAKGAETSIYLATSAEVKNTTGCYFEKCLARKSSALSYDESLAARVWELSGKMTGIKT